MRRDGYPERFLYEGTMPDKLSAALFINENAGGQQSGSIEDAEDGKFVYIAI